MPYVSSDEVRIALNGSVEEKNYVFFDGNFKIAKQDIDTMISLVNDYGRSGRVIM